MEPSALLVANLLEAFKQLNAYMTVGLVASISAAALERRTTAATDTESVALLGGFPALPRPTAQLLLIGMAFVSGAMASYSAEAAAHIVSKLGPGPLLDAACTFPSVATAPIGVPILASALPVVFAGIVMLRKLRTLRETGILLLLILFVAPYFVVAFTLVPLHCRAL